MTDIELAQAKPSAKYADRRRDKRYQLDHPGLMQREGHDLRVLLSDISASGALAAVEESAPSFRLGEVFKLAIEDFDVLDAKVVHHGEGFYGIAFTKAHLHRQRLKEWLLEAVQRS